MSLSQKYRKSLEQRWSLRFKTTHPEGDNIDGVVTHNKRKFVVIREERDFRFDGVLVVAKKCLSGFRDAQLEKCHNAILHHTNEIKNAKSPRWLDKCENIHDVLVELKQRSIWPGIEIIYDDDSVFYLGPIEQVHDDSVDLNCYDATGKWEKTYEIDFHEIYRIEFDSDYCNAFNSYMQTISDTNQAKAD
jgi:hypothetical protein